MIGPILASFLLLPFACALNPNAQVKSYNIPNSLYDGPVQAEYTSTFGSIDGPKISPRPNSTSYEWWYFDVVSTTSANESITIVFYESSPTAFLTSQPPLLLVSITGTFADGTRYNIPLEPAAANKTATSALITASNDAITGDWQSTGFSFRGSRGLTEYVIAGNNAANNVSGTLRMTSLAPSHLPCGRAGSANATEIMLPGVGWSNVIPGAAATVDFTIGGRRVHFAGVGYHDKNWGDVPFPSAVKSWYWGHAQLGPYTIVWFDARARGTDTEYVSGYVARDGKILSASCEANAVRARPWGANAAYPPVPGTETPSGFALEYNLGALGKFYVNATQKLTQVDGQKAYLRDIGDVSGGFVHKEQHTGRALWELFNFP